MRFPFGSLVRSRSLFSFIASRAPAAGVAVPLVAILSTGCQVVDEASAGKSKGESGTSQSAIINGSADTTHDAVVAIVLQEGNQGGLCTGTIVKVDAARHIGWVATAAHCVSPAPVMVLQGPDFNASSAIAYQVVDFAADPRYDGDFEAGYDFAVIRIAGVDANTAVIPLASATDGVSNGSPTTSVGYGRTSVEEGGPENSKRNAVSHTIAQSNAKFLVYNQQSKGICQGDSGGPVLFKSGGTERVVGIHSYVAGGCDGAGYSGRVSGELDFLNQQLTKALPPDSCGLCEKVANSGTSECAQITQSCLANPDCKGYYDCLSEGAKPETCVAKFPHAEGPFNAAATCTCLRACTTQCAGSTSCRLAPKCGYKLPSGEACTTCTEGSCCAEMLDCASDGLCYVCLKGKDADPGCATNAVRKKLATCVASKCATDCAGSGLENGADPVPEAEGEGGGGDGTTTTTTTTSGGCASAPGSTEGNLGLAALGALALVAGAARRARRSR